MEMQIQPPKPLPLHVVGWLSLPWRHWGYLSGTLVFGLLFLTFAPFNFLVRLLVLVVPFLSALVLAFPYGGLHMDEWLVLAWKYVRRPGVRIRDQEEQEESLDELLGEGLDDDQPPAAEASGLQLFSGPPAQAAESEKPTPPPAWPGQLAPLVDWPESEIWVSSDPTAGQMAGVLGQRFFTATSGVFRRGSGKPLRDATSERRAWSDAAAWSSGAAGVSWRPSAPQPVDEPMPPSAAPIPASREPRDPFAADGFLLEQPTRKLRRPRRTSSAGRNELKTRCSPLPARAAGHLPGSMRKRCKNAPMLTRFTRNRKPRSSQSSRQRPRLVRRQSITEQARAAIASVGQNYVVDSEGCYSTVFRLRGSDVGVVDEQVLASRLKSLTTYLQRTPGLIQRISSSYLQPLDPYLAYLSGVALVMLQQAPHLFEPLQELAVFMEDARDRFQARLGEDYWVVTYSSHGSFVGWRGQRGNRSSAAQRNAAAQVEAEEPLGGGLRGRLQRMQQAARARALAELDEHCALLVSTLQRAEIQAERLSGPELAALFTASWGRILKPLPSDEDGAGDLAPAELESLIRTPPGVVELTSRWACTSDGGYVRSWYIRDFGERITSGMISRLAQMPGIRVLQYCEQVPPTEARRVLRLNRTITTSEQYLRPQRDIPDYDWAAKVQSNDEVRAGISFRGDAVFRYRALIQQWASSEEELEERSHAFVLDVQDHAQIVAHQATFRQDDALVSGLPLGHCRLRKPERNMNTDSLACLFYPGPRDPLQPEGVWLGMALPSRLMVTMDLFKLQNPVVELVGIMGSGKSMTQKFLLTQLIAQGYPGFVLDGAREYISTVEALEGRVVRLGSVHGPGFNPVHFDPLDESEEGDPFIVGQALFLDWVEAALHPLSDIEKTVTGEAYMRALETKGIQRDDRTTWEQPRPLLSDVYAALFEEPGDQEMGYDNPQVVARRLALALKPFALGVYAPLFNRPDQFVLGSEQLICFDVYDVPDRLRLAFVHQLLAFIQRQTLRRYRYLGSVVVLDEGHLLLHDERSAQILEHLVRNGRKAGQLMMFTQHTHSDSQRNRSAQLAHKTAGATLVFRINRQDVATLDDLHLSDLEKQIVVEQGEGECLLVAPSGHLQLKVLIPPTWYARFTTKPAEVLDQQRPAAADQQSIAETLNALALTPMPENGVEPPPPARAASEETRPASPPQMSIEVTDHLDKATWEKSLVGATQVASEWLLRAEASRLGEMQSAAKEAAPDLQPVTLQIVWSQPAQSVESNNDGGSAYQPDDSVDRQALTRP